MEDEVLIYGVNYKPNQKKKKKGSPSNRKKEENQGDEGGLKLSIPEQNSPQVPIYGVNYNPKVDILNQYSRANPTKEPYEPINPISMMDKIYFEPVRGLIKGAGDPDSTILEEMEKVYGKGIIPDFNKTEVTGADTFRGVTKHKFQPPLTQEEQFRAYQGEKINMDERPFSTAEKIGGGLTEIVADPFLIAGPLSKGKAASKALQSGLKTEVKVATEAGDVITKAKKAIDKKSADIYGDLGDVLTSGQFTKKGARTAIKYVGERGPDGRKIPGQFRQMFTPDEQLQLVDIMKEEGKKIGELRQNLDKSNFLTAFVKKSDEIQKQRNIKRELTSMMNDYQNGKIQLDSDQVSNLQFELGNAAKKERKAMQEYSDFVDAMGVDPPEIIAQERRLAGSKEDLVQLPNNWVKTMDKMRQAVARSMQNYSGAEVKQGKMLLESLNEITEQGGATVAQLDAIQDLHNTLEYTQIGNTRTTVGKSMGSAFGQVRGDLKAMLEQGAPELAASKERFSAAATVVQGRVGRHMSELMRSAQTGRFMRDAFDDLMRMPAGEKPGAIVRSLAHLGLSNPKNLNTIMARTRQVNLAVTKPLDSFYKHLTVMGPKAAEEFLKNNPKLVEPLMEGMILTLRASHKDSDIGPMVQEMAKGAMGGGEADAAALSELEGMLPPMVMNNPMDEFQEIDTDEKLKNQTGLQSIQDGKITDPGERQQFYQRIMVNPNISEQERMKILGNLYNEGQLTMPSGAQ
jgi:hypothetical protein